MWQFAGQRSQLLPVYKCIECVTPVIHLHQTKGNIVEAFFKTELSELLNDDHENTDNELRADARRFFDDCKGAADGEMDISFQETGRGYYAHLHQLATLEDDVAAYAAYRDKVLEEIDTAENDGALTHQMKVVKEQLI